MNKEGSKVANPDNKKSKVICYNCGKEGHIKTKCQAPKSKHPSQLFLGATTVEKRGT